VRSQWVVQHVAARSRAEAQAWRLRTPALADARIVALARREEGEHYFVVVSGPFADRDAAARFVQQQGLAATTWIRGAASLKASLPPEDSRR
jgi:septal ring-binding cell division protein DamX